MNKREEYLKITEEIRHLCTGDVSDEIIDPMLDRLDKLWYSMGFIDRCIIELFFTRIK